MRCGAHLERLARAREAGPESRVEQPNSGLLAVSALGASGRSIPAAGAPRWEPPTRPSRPCASPLWSEQSADSGTCRPPALQPAGLQEARRNVTTASGPAVPSPGRRSAGQYPVRRSWCARQSRRFYVIRSSRGYSTASTPAPASRPAAPFVQFGVFRWAR
jgi:hypothetical protein